MGDVTVSVRLPEKIHELLTSIAKESDRSRSYIIKQAITRHVESEAEIIAGIKIAQQEAREGNVVSLEESKSRIERIIADAFKAKNTLRHA